MKKWLINFGKKTAEHHKTNKFLGAKITKGTMFNDERDAVIHEPGNLKVLFQQENQL